MPLFNQEQYIARALNSVLSQTFTNFEVVIINDGSTDSSTSIVSEFTDHRIRLINQKNQGVSSARNAGVKNAKFELIAFLDSDDEWFPSYLEHIFLLYRKYPGCSVYATRYQISIGQKLIKKIKVNRLDKNFIEGIIENYFEICAHSDPLLWTSATAAKKEALLDIGGFPDGCKSGEDLITWARLACKYKIAYRNEILSTYCVNRVDSETPKRKPDKPDLVGRELFALSKRYKLNGMKSYLGWYKKNRAVHFFESGDRFGCLLSAVQSFVFSPISLKSLQLLVLPIASRKFYFHRKFLNENNNNRR